MGRSAADLAIGLLTEISGGGIRYLSLLSPLEEGRRTFPKVGLCPNTPQKDAGIRIEPPISPPI